MDQLSPPNAQKLSNILKFLTVNDDDDRLLDLIQLPVSVHGNVDTYSDTNRDVDLNSSADNHCYDVVDEDDKIFGTTNRGGRELHMCGYSYYVKEENDTTTRWRCVIRVPACPTTIHTNNADDSFKQWNGAHHNHPPNENRLIIKSVMAKMKARVLIEPYPVAGIAEEEIRKAKFTRAQLAAMPLPSQIGMFWPGGRKIILFFVFFNFF